MTGVPEPVPLDPPPGDVGGLEDVVEDVAGVAYWLTVLSGDLSGPAAAAPGWLGADAAAAAAQVGAVAGIARECSATVGAAAHRLRLHHDLLRDVRRQVEALRAEQADDFSSAGQGLSALGAVGGLALMSDAPELVAVIDRLRAAEDARRSQHAALLEEVAEDAAATMAVLADASASVGGRGAPGDGARVLAHLAAELPGWGDRELAALGAALAGDLHDSPLRADERDHRAGQALALAGSPIFAAALLAGLGRDGVEKSLADLGDGAFGTGNAVARLLATSFGAAASVDAPEGVLDRVLTAHYPEEAEPGRERDLVMYGMAAVLSASTTLRSGGLQPSTVVRWGKQIVAGEDARADVHMQQRWPPLAGTPIDPLTAVLGALQDLGSRSSAAAVLGEPAAWSLLLGRPWADGGAALAEVAARAGADDGPDGERATRLGLEALGAGLGDGDPDGWTVDRGTAAKISPVLATAAAQHVTVLTGVLGLGLDGELHDRAGDLLRGLGYLTLDDGAERTVRTALADWVRSRPALIELTCDPIPPSVVVVPSAFLAVREYGQRLAYALHGFEAQAEAEHDERLWNATVGLLAEVPKRPDADVVVTVLEGYAAMVMDKDGWWDNGRDEGLRLDADAAAAAVLRLAPAAGDDVRGALAGSARVVFDRTGEALGEPRPPVPEERDLLGPVKDAATGVAEDKAFEFLERRVAKAGGQGGGRVFEVLVTAVHPF
jgi:hypothetical protein